MSIGRSRVWPRTPLNTPSPNIVASVPGWWRRRAAGRCWARSDSLCKNHIPWNSTANLGKIAHMGSRIFKQRTPPPVFVDVPPTLRPIASEPQWSLTEYVCSAGPHDRTFEERHDRMSIALVTSGTFRYRTDTGEGILYPGAFLLGNAGACYECGHEHSHGDRCMALHIDRELFGEIASGSSGSTHCGFRTAILPAVSGPGVYLGILFSEASTPESKLVLEEAILICCRDRSARGGNQPHTTPPAETGGDPTDDGRIRLYR